MNVLRVIPSMNPKLGGPSQGIRNSIPASEELGLINEVVSFDDPAADFIVNSPFTINALGVVKNPWQYNAKFTRWLSENSSRFDVIIIHGLWLYHSYATHKTIQKLGIGIPLFIMPHGMLDPWFQKAEGRKFKAIRNWFYWHLLEKEVVNGVDGLLFTCAQELSLARESFTGYHPKQELNIGYGVPSPPPDSPALRESFLALSSIKTRVPYLLFISRIHEKKGVDLLIKSYLSLKKEGIKLPKLVIAGPGLDTPFGKQMISLAYIDHDISFPGMLTGETKWGAFYGCEAFILPSHQENFGISVAEALACSKPVLISDQVNIWREISSENACLVEKDSEEGIYKMLYEWSKMSANEKQRMGKNAKLVANKYFTITQVAQRMSEVLNELLVNID